jgi:putative FmdB family regulatory protein
MRPGARDRRGLRDVVGGARPVEREDRLAGTAGRQRGPLQGDRVALEAGLGRALRYRHGRREPRVREDLGHDRAGLGREDLEVDGVGAVDEDRLHAPLEREPLLPAQVGAVGEHPLQREVSDVRAEVREPPRERVVVADDHSRQAGERESGDVEGAVRRELHAVQAHLEPDVRLVEREVRVVGQDRLAGVRVLARDHERVRADAVAAPEQDRHRVEGVGRPGERVQGLARGEPGCRAGAADAGTHVSLGGLGPWARDAAGVRVPVDRPAAGRVVRDGLPARTGVVVGGGTVRGGLLAAGRGREDRGVEVLGEGREQGLDDLDVAEHGAQGRRPGDLRVEVAPQVPRHGLQPGERVDGRPRLDVADVDLERQHRVLQPEAGRLAVGDVGVDAVRVGLVEGLRLLAEEVPLLLRDPPPPEGADHGVGLDRLRHVPDQLGEAAGRHVPAVVHLEEPVLGVDVAERGHEVRVRAGVDVGHAEVVADDLDVGGESRQDLFAAVVGQGPTHEEGDDAGERHAEDEQDGQERDEDLAPRCLRGSSCHGLSVSAGSAPRRTSLRGSGRGATIGTRKGRLLTAPRDRRTQVPTYAYRCTVCNHQFEAKQSFSDDSLTVCPECGGALRKLFNSVGVVFKGSGFYRTDSRSGSSASTAAASTSSSSGSSSGSSSDSSSTSSSSSSSSSTSSSSSSGSSSTSAA